MQFAMMWWLPSAHQLGKQLCFARSQAVKKGCAGSTTTTGQTPQANVHQLLLLLPPPPSVEKTHRSSSCRHQPGTSTAAHLLPGTVCTRSITEGTRFPAAHNQPHRDGRRWSLHPRLAGAAGNLLHSYSFTRVPPQALAAPVCSLIKNYPWPLHVRD